GSIDAEGAFDLNTSLGTAATVAGTIDPSTTVITGTITPDESGGGGGGSGGGGGGGSGGGGGGGGGTPINFTGSSPSSPPAVVPAAQTVAAGASPKLIVTGSGTVQWQLNGVNISGATDSMLKLPDIGTDQAGTYTAVVTGSDDSVTSLSGTVAVTVSAHLANLSARGYVESGSDQLVVGYVVSGSGPKQILVRGDGPALINFYITDPLEAPELTLYDDKAAVISTDIGWSNPLMAGPSMSAAAVQPATAAIMKQVYAFPLVADSADCAMLATVPPAAYTASVTSADGGTGIALAELYDADTGTPASHLINISARALAGTGSQVLVAGFVISGSSSETVLIRGIGPALGPPPFNIAGYLATPTLTLYDSSNKVIATNVGWGNAPGTGTSTVAAGVETATAAVMKDVGAFSLPSNSADCAMTVTLPPGDYTAQVSGAGSASGIALAEIYDVP
ncbi:MAG: hypothetical protein ACREFX_03395, partial [Opitutaceae bacterium]